jgi:hypothetical protein
VNKRILADDGTHNGDIDPAQFAYREIVAPDRLELHLAALRHLWLFMGITATARHKDRAEQSHTHRQQQRNPIQKSQPENHKIKPPPLERATKWAYFVDF